MERVIAEEKAIIDAKYENAKTQLATLKKKEVFKNSLYPNLNSSIEQTGQELLNIVLYFINLGITKKSSKKQKINEN